jgi:hypothetical protein
MTRPVRGAAGPTLAARLATLLGRRASPFVTQAELRDLVTADRSDIARQVRQTQWMMRHPRRGMPAAPFLLLDDWKRFLHWADGAIQHLDQPQPAPQLEHLIRTWQHRRDKIPAPTLRWRRRADVIAV